MTPDTTNKPEPTIRRLHTLSAILAESRERYALTTQDFDGLRRYYSPRGVDKPFDVYLIGSYRGAFKAPRVGQSIHRVIPVVAVQHCDRLEPGDTIGDLIDALRDLSYLPWVGLAIGYTLDLSAGAFEIDEIIGRVHPDLMASIPAKKERLTEAGIDHDIGDDATALRFVGDGPGLPDWRAATEAAAAYRVELHVDPVSAAARVSERLAERLNDRNVEQTIHLSSGGIFSEWPYPDQSSPMLTSNPDDRG